MSYNSQVVNADSTTRKLVKIWGRQEGKILAPTSTKSIEFDGSGDYVEVPDTDSLSFGDSANDVPFSISAWVNVTEDPISTEGAIVSKFNSGASSEYLLYHTAGNQLFLVLYDNASGATLQAYKNTFFTPNQWVHIVATYDAQNKQNGINFYLNGELVTLTGAIETGTYVAMNNKTAPFRVGVAATNTFPFEGRISNVVVYNKELNLSEVQELYNVGDSGRIKNMEEFSDTDSIISWWKLGDGDTNATNGVLDSVGTNHGTLRGDAKIVQTKNLKSDYKLITI